MFRHGDTAILTVLDEEGEFLGTEEVQIVGHDEVAPIVFVRPFNSDDILQVSITHLDEVA